MNRSLPVKFHIALIGFTGLLLFSCAETDKKEQVKKTDLSEEKQPDFPADLKLLKSDLEKNIGNAEVELGFEYGDSVYTLDIRIRDSVGIGFSITPDNLSVNARNKLHEHFKLKSCVIAGENVKSFAFKKYSFSPSCGHYDYKRLKPLYEILLKMGFRETNL